MAHRTDEPLESRAPGSTAAWSEAGSDLGGATAGGSDRYARGGELGRGGMGVVEAAVDTWLDRDVAVKRPRADRAEEHVARVTREARITARLVHPAIPPVYDVGEDEQGPFYTMPVLVGTTLNERIAAGGASLRALVDAVATACRAAGYAHARGVVHRDLKPANLLLGAFGEVWVLDWGVALDPAHPDTAVVGTPGFQAPEQRAGAAVTPAADVYGLGVTLGAVLDAFGEARPELRAVVERATRADPGERYADGAALAQELDRWLDGHLVQAHAYPAREILWHLAVRWRTPLAVGALAVGVLAALGAVALEAQRAERARADLSLSVALAQQATSLRLRDARPEAEVLAAHSLALAENPLARGVLMAWAASPPMALREVSAAPCDGPFVEPDGHAICVDTDVRVLDPGGRVLWAAPLGSLVPTDGKWVGAVVAARRYDGGAVVIRRSSNHLEVWREGTRRHTIDTTGAYLGLADGPVPAVYDSRRVGLLDLDTGVVTWGPPTCDHVETALVRHDAVVVGCRDALAYVGSRADLGSPVEVPGHPSALGWQGGPVIGTFEGDVLVGGADGWAATPAGVGAVRQILALPGDRVAVVGERGQARVGSPRDGAFFGTLPRGVSSAALVDGDLVTFGASRRRHALPADLRPVAYDRAGEGGISTFDVSPSGEWLVAGSASGEVVSWRAATGASAREVPPGDATAKSVRFVGERAFVHALPADGVLRREIGEVTPAPFARAFARAALRHGDGLALLPWSLGVVLVDEVERLVPLPARPLAATAGDALWVADERGGVHELVGDAFVPRFDLPRPTSTLATSGDWLVTSDGAAVEARSRDGVVQWRFEGTAPVTALDATREWIAAGDRDGRVLVLHPDGALVAAVTGHARLVSDLVIRDDVLYSGSWDGFVRAWSLAAADAADPIERVTRTWGLTLEEALAGADPLGPGR